jgi:hypothetical protein
MLTRAVSSRSFSTAKLAAMDAKRDLREEAKLLVKRALAMRAERERTTGQTPPAVEWDPREMTPGVRGILPPTNLTFT